MHVTCKQCRLLNQTEIHLLVSGLRQISTETIFFSNFYRTHFLKLICLYFVHTLVFSTKCLPSNSVYCLSKFVEFFFAVSNYIVHNSIVIDQLFTWEPVPQIVKFQSQLRRNRRWATIEHAWNNSIRFMRLRKRTEKSTKSYICCCWNEQHTTVVVWCYKPNACVTVKPNHRLQIETILFMPIERSTLTHTQSSSVSNYKANEHKGSERSCLRVHRFRVCMYCIAYSISTRHTKAQRKHATNESK